MALVKHQTTPVLVPFDVNMDELGSEMHTHSEGRIILATEDVLCALYAEYMTTALHTGMWVTNGSLKGALSSPKKAPVLNIRDRWGWGESSKVCSLKVSDCISW